MKIFIWKKEYCKCISVACFKIKTKINLESSNTYSLNISIFQV